MSTYLRPNNNNNNRPFCLDFAFCLADVSPFMHLGSLTDYEASITIYLAGQIPILSGASYIFWSSNKNSLQHNAGASIRIIMTSLIQDVTLHTLCAGKGLQLCGGDTGA